jgi:hypothetical protein
MLPVCFFRYAREDDFSTKINELAEKPENQDKKPPPEGQHETGRNPKNARRGPSRGAGKGPREGGFTENGEKLSKMLGGDRSKGASERRYPTIRARGFP